MNRYTLFFLLILLISSDKNVTYGWIFPEHRDITRAGIENLSAEQRKLFEDLWKIARTGSEGRLSPFLIFDDGLASGTLVDFAAFPAISGDHSVSGRDMLKIVLHSTWIKSVIEIANELKSEIAQARTREDLLNALRNSDLMLQRADPEYASRAGHNDVHFLRSLQSMTQSLSEYMAFCIKPGAELNALGVYIYYHNLALYKASFFSSADLGPDERTRLVISVLADEAFALHFLEDFTAAGHAAGVWGAPSQKKGSHDYYNEHGIQTTTWAGEPIIVVGDAWMRDEDVARTAALVKLSLEQMLNSFSGGLKFSSAPVKDMDIFSPGNFDISKVDFMPEFRVDPNVTAILLPLLSSTTVPALSRGLGELPRFRAELGFFAGLAASLTGTAISRGFGKDQDFPGAISGVDATIKLGVGLDDVLSESSDGLAFLGIGIKRESGASSGIVNLPETKAYGNLLSSIPARTSYNIKLRCPFFLIPGDLILSTPILSFIAPQTLEKMAAFAANGGWIPWQAGISTSVGRFQFILGREISVQLFGLNDRDVFYQRVTTTSNESGFALFSYKSTRIELPILEYRPFRSFAADQSSKLFIQFYGGVDIPYDLELVEKADIIQPELENIWYLGFRLAFDWRYYF
ncbi:MAG: hypothetical protein J0L60_02310 [Ignavibacteria bacterium]|nr:hypothetical protein [Ignavibacteria bacterium]